MILSSNGKLAKGYSLFCMAIRNNNVRIIKLCHQVFTNHEKKKKPIEAHTSVCVCVCVLVVSCEQLVFGVHPHGTY